MADSRRISTLTDRERDVVERLARHGSSAAKRGDMWLAELCRTKARQVFEQGLPPRQPIPPVLRRLGRAGLVPMGGR